jgi:hypothetical protein
MKVIAVSLLVVSLALHPGVGHAAWQSNGTGVAIVAGTQARPSITPDGVGGTIITWYDSRSGSDDIYAQRLNGLGVAQWASNGVVVCAASGDQVDPQIVPDGCGGAIVAWLDSRSGAEDIFAQRVDGCGNVYWPTDGVVLSGGAGNLGTNEIPSLISDGNGGAIVAWTDLGNGSANTDILAQRVNGSGILHWSGGVPLCRATGNQSSPVVVSDGSEGAIVTWTDGRNGTTNADIYARRVTASGALQWGVLDGVPVCAAANSQNNAQAVPDGKGGVIVAWADLRGGGGSKVYAQRLDASGSPMWTSNGVALCTAASIQIAPELVRSGIDGAIVAWNDNQNGSGYFDIYGQRLDGSGAVQWPASGAALCTGPNDQFFFHDKQPGIVTDGAGGAFLTWEDQGHWPDPRDIYAQHVNINGEVQWGQDGAALCTAVSDQERPAITYIAYDVSAVVTWQDQRSGDFDVYALPVPNTPIRSFERYVPYPHGIIIAPDPHIWPVRLLFDNVITAGFTYLDITPAGPSLPRTFVLGDGRYYNLSTTAGTTDNIQVCIKFDPAALQHPAAALRMFQYNVAGPAGPTWLDVTTGSVAGDSICGTTTHLSTFVIGWPSVTGVGDTPASFALHANVPNPFNPITTIRYDVPASGADVSISIYDVSGRLIRSLVREHRGAGAWSAQWNGENDRGQSVASGVYFYRMRAGEFVETKKMMLLK